MEYKQYLSALWKWWWLIVLATVLAAVVSYWASVRVPPVYETSTTLLVGQLHRVSNPNQGDFGISQQLAQSYAQLVRRAPIMQSTVDALGLGMRWEGLARNVHATAVPGTQLIQVSVADTDPPRAKRIADEIAHQLILQSPTPQEQELEAHGRFAREQLEILQTRLREADLQLNDLKQQATEEKSALRLVDLQTQIEATETKITNWQRSYIDLLGHLQGSRTNFLSVLEPSSIPITPISPNIPLNVALAASIGFLLAVGAAMLLEYLNDTVGTAADVKRLLSLPTVGTISHMGELTKPSDRLAILSDPRSEVSEAYRIMRTNVQFASVDEDSLMLLVSSAGPQEGKTTTAVGLAVSFARAGKRVILADTDLRRPSIHTVFGTPDAIGLTSLLLGEVPQSASQDIEDSVSADNTSRKRKSHAKRWLDACLVPTEVPGLRILPCGPLPPNPAELLASSSMEQVLRDMNSLADVVILDSPPILPVTDTALLAGRGIGVVMVVEAGKTRSQAAILADQTLRRAPQAKILGVVLNKSARRRGSYYTYRYGEDRPVSRTTKLRSIFHLEMSAPPGNADGNSSTALAGKRGVAQGYSSLDSLPPRNVAASDERLALADGSASPFQTRRPRV
jgi:Mrp family chromosome partitioning ATPase/capsular polysaccharide biosynthesis protein